MMNQLYNAEDFVGLRGVSKRYALVAAIVLAVALAVCTSVCFFVNDGNVTWLKVINIVISSIGGCVSIYLLFDKIIPSFARADYIDKILSSTSQSVVGVVENTGRVSTVAKYVSATELKLSDDNGRTVVLYWDCNFDCPDFDGLRVAFSIVQNRIVAYGVV